MAGAIRCWGYNGDGRRDVPISLQSRSDFVDVDCANDHCCALSAAGELACFGTNIPADLPSESGYVELVYHDDGGCVLDAQGQPTCWGNDDITQLPLILGGN